MAKKNLETKKEQEANNINFNITERRFKRIMETKKVTQEEIQKILNNIPKVENMTSHNGREIPNQFIATGQDFVLFQSYKSPIAMFKSGKTYIFKNWNYSTTTGKYRNQFLNETKKETLEKLKSGEYIAVDFSTENL